MNFQTVTFNHSKTLDHMSPKTSFIWEIPEQEFRKVIAESTSWSAVVRRYFRHDGNSRTIKARVKEDGIDTSHFLGHAWAKNMKRPECSYPRYKLEEILVKNSDYKNNQNLINRLVNVNLLERKCVECGIDSIWNGRPITLQLDHINGDNRDNRIENLRVLCPNCHSQTDTWCGKSKFRDPNKKIKPEKKDLVNLVFINTCVDCLVDICSRASRCSSCSALDCNKSQRRVERPPKAQFFKELSESNYSAMGRKYGVSDNSIRKWVKTYNNSS